MINEIYKLTLVLYSNNYEIREDKYKCKEKKATYVVDYGTKRLNKNKIGVINNDNQINNITSIRFSVYILDLSEKEKYIKELTKKAEEVLKLFEEKIKEMSDKFKEEPKMRIRNNMEE